MAFSWYATGKKFITILCQDRLIHIVVSVSNY